MDDLSERIRASIENPKSDPWFPELTPDLTASAWDKLSDEIGLTLDSYGTARVLSRVAANPRDIVRSLETCRLNCGKAPSISIEALPLEVALRYHKAGITFYSSEDILNTPVLTCVDDALSIINRVPSLMRAVAALVRSFHVIKPKNLNNDVSFSEPEVPFSIFVSVPEERVENDALRVAEAIVHEAMHLQLTAIEKLIPLVNRTRDKYFSPWRMTYRPAQGILHALYVFGVIEEFLNQLTSRTNSANHVRQYADERRADIGSQINAIERFQYAPDLTSMGLCFVKNLLEV
ncbi:MAG: HEXXH motif-containing putative peptide modification protein [Nitrososphaera sp.]|nr:HEXXH motif-containing putative peptide modification protein [Nitrososphaera sp.]